MKIFAAIAAAAAMMWLAGLVSFTVYTSSLSADTGDRTRTDAIIVLTGGPNRIATGLSLLHEGLGERLFISGVDSRVSLEKLLALSNSTNTPCCITLGHEAQNTAGNAAEARQWAEKENIRSLRLVTAAYHMPRAWLEFHRALPEAAIITCPVTGDKGSSLPLVFMEYNKTLLTLLRHRL